MFYLDFYYTGSYNSIYKKMFENIDILKAHIHKANIFYERTELLNQLVKPVKCKKTNKSYEELYSDWLKTKQILLKITKKVADKEY
jgi:hypothetical protein